MASAPTTAPAELKPTEAASLLEKVLNGQGGAAGKVIAQSLEARIGSIEEIVPSFMKGQGERLIKRALLTFSMKKELHGCTPQSFVMCVLQGAECGVAIDGKLGHAVPRNVKVSRKGEPDKWEKQACFQPDYKALVAQAKRSGQIVDCYTDVICRNDDFKHGKFNGDLVLEHTYDIRIDRGEVVGAYAIYKLPDGGFHYELMSEKELEEVRSKAKETANSPAHKDHRNEMRKKTVVRRGLKFFAEDPGINRLLELDDESYVLDVEAESAGEPIERPRSIEGLTKKLSHDRSPAFTPPTPTTRRETVPVSSQSNGVQDHVGQQEEPEPESYESEETTEAESEASDGPQFTEEESQEEQPSAAKGLPADAWQRFETCTSKGSADEMAKTLHADCRTDEERMIVDDYCERRKQEITESRGERSNAKGKPKPKDDKLFDAGGGHPS